MKIVLVSPAWSRFDVTRLALAQRRWLCDELATRGHDATSVIVADDENLEIAAEYGFETVEVGNDDLGEKFNAGYRHAAELGADLFVHIGSDDWVHPDVFTILDEVDLSKPPATEPTINRPVAAWNDGWQVLAQKTLTVADLPTGRLQRCQYRRGYGCIPWLIPRAVFEPFGFAPIRPGLQRGCDGALASRIRARTNWVVRDLPADMCVDFKSDPNLTPFDPMIGNIGVGPLRSLGVLSGLYPGELVDQAWELSGRMAAVAA